MSADNIKSILYVRLPCPPIFPAGIAYLSDHVHKQLPEVRQQVLDLSLSEGKKEEEDLLRAIEEFSPEAIAFSWRDIQPFSPDEDDESLKNSFTFYHSQDLVKKAKAALKGVSMVWSYDNRIRRNLRLIWAAHKKSKDSRIWLGGPAMGVFAPIIVKKCPPGTVAVSGEGETALVKLLQGKEPLEENIFVNKGGGKILSGTGRSYLDLSKSTPMDYDYLREIFPEFQYYVDNGYISVQTKRGCPYRCLFCVYNYIDGREVRYRPPAVIAQDVENLNRQHGVKKIWFSDSQFIPTVRSHEIVNDTLDELLKRNLDIQWSSYVRVDTLSPYLSKKYPDLPRKMLESGIEEFELSMTTGSQKMIKNLRLGYRLPQFMEACKVIKESGYKDQPIKLNLSFNAPGETRETILETIKTVRDIEEIFGPQNVRPFIFFLAVQPHTGLAKVSIEQGRLKPGFNPLALNPLIIKNLIYNPPPLGRPIARACLNALDNGSIIGEQVLSSLEEELK